MKNLSKYFVVVVIASVFLLFPKNNAQAACIFNEAFANWWSKTTVALNESVGFTVPGNVECANKTVIVEFYGQSGFDFFIKTMSVKANSSGNTPVTVSFSATDFGVRSGDQRVYYKIKTEDGSSNQLTSQDLTVRLSTGGSCTLTSAQWRWNFRNEKILGSPLHMMVSGRGCAGYGVSFKIYTDDSIDYEIDTINGTFDSTGTSLDVIWVANNRNDSRPISSSLYNYNFYFIASAGTGQGNAVTKVTSDTVMIPTNSQNGCINCNNIFAPSTCVCADNFSESRGLASSCDSVCSSHIGDAKSDTLGTGGGGMVCGNNRCETGESPINCPADCKPGQTQTYPFSIENPLKGGANDFTGLVKIIAQWLFNLAIPIAVAMIVYSGILFLTAQGEPAKVTKAKEVLKYAVIGLAIILIGSILELGSSSPASNSGQPTLPTNNTGGNTALLGAVGGKCTGDRDCFTGLKCQDTICKRGTGNLINEPCNSARNCDVGSICDKSDLGLQVIDGQTLGTCLLDNNVTGGRIGDVCERDSNCISGLKCNKICQRRDGNLIGEPCVNTAPGGNCNSQACSTFGSNVVGTCVIKP